jgi:hypothetical protein
MIKDIKILSVIITITILLYIYTFSFDEVPEILAQGMQPTMMPRLIFTLIVFLSLFQIYQNKNLVEEKKEIIKTNAFITFGFILFIILIADTPLLWQRKDKFFVLLYSIGMTVFVFVFFTLVLQLKFPQGILEDFIVRNFY